MIAVSPAAASGLGRPKATLMHPSFAFYAASTLLDACAGLLITAAHYVVLFAARRRSLTAFLRWLVPSALASTVSLLAWLLRVLSPNFTFLSPGFLLVCAYLLEALATALAVAAMVQLWKMIKGWPLDTGAVHSLTGEAAAHHEGVWPPPPTGPA